jgi:hypothetical protein
MVCSSRIGCGSLTNSPSGSIEVLPSRAHGEGQPLNLWRQGCDSRKGHVIKPIVYFVGKDDDFILDAKISYVLELLF